MLSDMVAVDGAALTAFTAQAFERSGVAAEDARIAADVLVAADLRGVDSHGVARLHHYVAHLRAGKVQPERRLTVVREAPATLALDAGNGIGMVAAHYAMRAAIERAERYGIGAVTVRNSNHFGIAGYYAMLALAHNMIGVAMCNASPNVVPFGGAEALLGTNPIAWAIPCGTEPALVMDMATSGISYGKFEVALRTGAALPIGWALGADGMPTTDALAGIQARRILPLGGLVEGTGYKGYALATVVEALSHALAGAALSREIGAVQGRGEQASNIGHFFAAYRVDGFRDLAEFQADMDRLVQLLHSCPPAAGGPPVLVPGEREHQTALERGRDGIPLHPEVVALLRQVAADLGIAPVA